MPYLKFLDFLLEPILSIFDFHQKYEKRQSVRVDLPYSTLTNPINPHLSKGLNNIIIAKWALSKCIEMEGDK